MRVLTGTQKAIKDPSAVPSAPATPPTISWASQLSLYTSLYKWGAEEDPQPECTSPLDMKTSLAGPLTAIQSQYTFLGEKMPPALCWAAHPGQHMSAHRVIQLKLGSQRNFYRCYSTLGVCYIIFLS